MNDTKLKPIKNLTLAPYSTLKVGGEAQYAYIPGSIEELIEIVKFHKNNSDDIHIIGAGSNLLISSLGVEGCVILTKDLDKAELAGENIIEAQAGIKSAMFSKFALEKSLGGAEFLIGIPGFIGGAVFMNAGAHGENIKDILFSVKVLDTENFEVVEFSKGELNLGYRRSAISAEKHIILSVKFLMNKKDTNLIQERMDFHVNYRAANHPPLTQPSLGSTFRNPENNYSACLLEEVGAKEYIHNGKVRFSTKHANFLYNFNNATSSEVLELMEKMSAKVLEKRNIQLIPEIKFIGKKTQEDERIWKNFVRH
ncbi:MAG: UDP-N-acetylmuramate dehydrogenase [Candidatus Gastranaerophilales bacterium]|nr:UDP-N-acetylmuramate dehydrogenase [Candidatus Gastranaerophilales bacterium]